MIACFVSTPKSLIPPSIHNLGVILNRPYLTHNLESVFSIAFRLDSNGDVKLAVLDPYRPERNCPVMAKSNYFRTAVSHQQKSELQDKQLAAGQ